jgi:hypothetical protein
LNKENTLLRLGNPATDRQSRLASHGRLRLWLLFAAACVVLFSIRMLRQPETAQRLDRLFLPPENSAAAPTTIDQALSGHAGETELVPTPLSLSRELETPQQKDINATGTHFDLSAVRDNTYFRPAENAAWFAVFDWLAKSESAQLASDSIGDVSYAQFIDQPEVYRGQIVTIRGTVEREELLEAPANDIGIEQYHRLILRPKGGGLWPIVVYSLELPPKFPHEGDTNAEAQATGIFFKNWSYSWQGGLGLAPVVLAKTLEWRPTVVTKRPRTKVSAPGLIAAIVAAILIATLVGWFAWRHTRRPANVLAKHREIIAPPPEETYR